MKLSDVAQGGDDAPFAELRSVVANALLDLHPDWAPRGHGRESAGNLSLDVVASRVGQFLEHRYDPKGPWESRMRAYLPDVLRAPHRRTGIRDRTGSRTSMLTHWFADSLGWSHHEQSHFRDLVTVCMKHLATPGKVPAGPAQPAHPPSGPRPPWDPLPEAWRAFHTSPAMAETRRLLHHEYDGVVEPLLLRMVDDNLFTPANPIDVEWSSMEIGLTDILNVLETVAWGAHTGASDPASVAATFGLWLDQWLRHDRFVALHHVIALRGHHNLAQRLGLLTPAQAHANRRTLIVYGPMMQGEPDHSLLGDALLLGRTTVSGRLIRVEVGTRETARRERHDAESTPAGPPDSSILVEVYRLPDNDFVLAEIDALASSDDPNGGAIFRRRLVRLPDDLGHPSIPTPSTAAWAYDWVLSPAHGAAVRSGDWHSRGQLDAPDGT